MPVIRSSKKKEDPPYVHRDYPKWKYHKTRKAMLVRSPAVELALGDGWVDSPAVFDEKKGPDAINPNDHKTYYAMKQDDVIDQIDAMTQEDTEALQHIREVEICNPAKDRVGGRPKVLQAIADKLGLLAEESVPA